MKKKKGVLITGASRGIGRAAALLLARYGFHLFLNSAHHLDALKEVQKEILRLPGASCELCPGNVGDPGQVRNMFSQISRSEQVDGGVEILINNAGISHIGLLSDMTDSEWNQVIATNLSSAFYCCREAIPHMVSKKNGQNPQYFFHVGTKRRILRSSLLRLQSGDSRPYPGAGQRTCAKQHPGKRHRFWSHRHRYEPDARSGRTARSPGRNPCRPLRRTGRGRTDDLTCSSSAFLYDWTNHWI